MATKYLPRQAEPDTRFTYHDAWDGEVELESDSKGVVRVASDGQDRAATALGLPVVKDSKSAPKEAD